MKNVFINSLYSENANSELGTEPNLFGQFIGEWEFEWFGYEPDKEVQYEQGEWIFSWVLEGRVIQDIWIIPGRKRRNKPGLPKGEYGTTLRHYNHTTKKWDIVWLGPIKNRFFTFSASQIGNEIVLEETNGKDGIMKWIFSDITKDSFNWRSVITKDNGVNWILLQEMKVKRKMSK